MDDSGSVLNFRYIRVWVSKFFEYEIQSDILLLWFSFDSGLDSDID